MSSRTDELLTIALARIVELEAEKSELTRRLVLNRVKVRDLEAEINRYPTADAYEWACNALNKHRERADKLEAAEKERLCNPCDYCACTEICDDANAYKEFIGEVMVQRGKDNG